jgi:putative transcriptional regulator
MAATECAGLNFTKVMRQVIPSASGSDAVGCEQLSRTPIDMLSCATPRHKVDALIRSNLFALMRLRQLKAAELARAAGVNRSAVTALANNRASRVELATLERLCIVLGCQLAELLEIVPDDESQAGAASRDGGI